MINRNSRGHSYSAVRGEILRFAEDELMRKHLPRMFFINQERKLGDQRRSDTVLVLTINDADSDSDESKSSFGTVGEIKVFGFWGEYGRKAETQRN